MKSVRLKPDTLIQTVLQDAQRALKADQGNRELSAADVAQLPAALKDVVDDFRAAGNARASTGDILGALRQSLEAGLRQSLTKGELVPGELSEDLGALLSFSSVGVQVQKAIADRLKASPADFSSAAQEAQVALGQADLSVSSQIRAVKELARAAQLAKTDAPDQALLLDGIAKDRARIVRDVVDQTVTSAQAALAQRPADAAAKQQLATALQAAIDVHAAVNPKSTRVKTLRQQLAQVGAEPVRSKAAQPFFARFLENQNRAQVPPQAQVKEPRMAVTMKYPSDNEDGGGEPIEATTKKFPPDAEDGGVEGPGGGGGVVTEKYPSDAEDGGVDGGGEFTTLKYPSDGEDGGSEIGGDDGGMVTTMKFPSDNEDGAGGDDGGVYVTMKYPSDNEDGGAGEPTAPVGPVDGTPDAPNSGAAQQISERVLAAASSGREGIEARIRELEDIGMRARFSAEGLREHNAEIAGLKAMLTGAAGVDARIREIEQLMMVALMTPEASAALQLELDVLRLLQAAFAAGFSLDV